jgi:hypothetical protein
MHRYLHLDKAPVAAFFFTEREKDYGGIHLGVPISSTEILLALSDEFASLPAGHSRSLPLQPVPQALPRNIVVRCRYRSLVSLRVATAINSVTRIQIDGLVGLITLSAPKLKDFESAIRLMTSCDGDLFIAGNSGSWLDRLWFWPLEV